MTTTRTTKASLVKDARRLLNADTATRNLGDWPARDVVLASIAISLARIADAMEAKP